MVLFDDCGVVLDVLFFVLLGLVVFQFLLGLFDDVVDFLDCALVEGLFFDQGGCLDQGVEGAVDVVSDTGVLGS